MINKLVRFVKNPRRYYRSIEELFLRFRSEFFSHLSPYSFLDDKYYLEYHFYKRFSYRLNLQNPQTFNEKLQWIKLFYRNPLYTRLADKYSVRNYVQEKIGKSYLVNLLGVYEDAAEIDWNLLPNRFVIKTTHSSGWNIICNNKETLDIVKANAILNKWIKSNYYETTESREWQYKNIQPRIIVEEYLEGDKIFGLLDYKFYCYCGEPKFILVCYNRYSDLRINFFDTDWNPLDVRHGVPNSELIFKKPINLDKMLEISRILSKNIPFCRIDLYSVKGNIYFSEVTICPSGGFGKFDSYRSDLLIGKPFLLPKKLKGSSCQLLTS